MNVVLLDRSANPVTKKGITGINLLTDSGETVVLEAPTPVNSLHYYYAKRANSYAEEEAKWEITFDVKWSNLGGAVGTMFSASETSCQTYGFLNEAGDNYILNMIVSKVPLTVGSIYTTDQICNG